MCVLTYAWTTYYSCGTSLRCARSDELVACGAWRLRPDDLSAATPAQHPTSPHRLASARSSLTLLHRRLDILSSCTDGDGTCSALRCAVVWVQCCCCGVRAPRCTCQRAAAEPDPRQRACEEEGSTVRRLPKSYPEPLRRATVFPLWASSGRHHCVRLVQSPEHWVQQ